MTLWHQPIMIERMGQLGEGIGFSVDAPQERLFVPYTLPGEKVTAEGDGERLHLVAIERPSPQRIAPICPLFSQCGGCAVQHWQRAAYQAWKSQLLASALRHQGIEIALSPLVDAHGEGRRRVTFHARSQKQANGRMKIETGFMQARSHQLISVAHCPILAPGLARAPEVAQALAEITSQMEKPLDIVITYSVEGLDVDLRGLGRLAFAIEQRLVQAAEALDLARLALHGASLIERRAPYQRFGRAKVTPPPGGFLQATEAGEQALADFVLEETQQAKRIADLFCGSCTFALRLAEKASVLAVENDEAALQSAARAARETPGLEGFASERRDLFRRPLDVIELKDYDAVVFDPPRAGAQAQALELARSDVTKIIAIACDVQSFARDARILIDGGYRLEKIIPVDQFLYSPHLEIAASFSKPKLKTRSRRIL